MFRLELLKLGESKGNWVVMEWIGGIFGAVAK